MMHDGMDIVLKEVRYIPELKKNLISLGMLDQSGQRMLDQSGCTFKSESGTLRFAKDSLTVMKGVIKNGLYTLIGKTVIGEASFVQAKMEDKVVL